MSSPATPLPPVSIAIDDPVSGDIQAVCATITAACNAVCTPQGQALIAAALKDSTSVQGFVSGAWNGFLKLFKK